MIVLFCFNISVPSPLPIFTSLSYVFFYVLRHDPFTHEILHWLFIFKCMLGLNRRPRGRCVIAPNESPSQNKAFTYLLTYFLVFNFDVKINDLRFLTFQRTGVSAESVRMVVKWNGDGSFRPLSCSPWVVSPWVVSPPSRFALHYVSRFALLPWVVSPTTWWVVSPTF